MAIAVTVNLFIFDEGETLHVWLGYGTLLILLLRSILGFTSNGAEAFKNFPLKASELLLFLKSVLSKKRKVYLGHNPIASYAFIFFWLMIIVLGVTGLLLVHTEHFWGDPLMEEIHEITAKFVIIFLVFHLVGILLDSILHKRKTWLSMMTGKK